MKLAQTLIVTIGMVLPHVASSLGGMGYSMGDFLFISVFNAIAWGSILAIGACYRHQISLLAPAVAGFGFLAWAHGVIGLGTGGQAAFGLIWIPIYALVPIAIGGVMGVIVDRHLTRLGSR